jgi:Fe-S-cluster containining protein
MAVTKNLNDIIKDYKNVHNYTIDGKCSGCGNCCSNWLPLTNNDVDRIKAYIRKNNIKEQIHCVPFSAQINDYTCPFLVFNGTNKKCSIYPVRPRICREFICDPNIRKRYSKSGCMDKFDMRRTFFGKSAINDKMKITSEEILTKIFGRF